MASSSSSSSLSVIIFLLLAPLCLSSESPLQIPNATLDLSVLWYGQFTPVQKERVHDFVESLNFDAKEGLDPKVSSWWKVVESYQERFELKEIYRQKKNNRTVTPRIKVKIVRTYVDEKMKYGNELTIGNGEKLVETATGNMSKVIPVVFLSSHVRAHRIGFCNRTCQQNALAKIEGKKEPQPYIMVSNPEVECPGECAWPFHTADKGPRGMIYQPPSGDVGADALVIQLATGLADFASNPAITKFLFKSDTTPFNDDGKRNHGSSSKYIENPSTECTGAFGSGAFPGFTGRIRVDPVTGGAFNSHGINHLKFLIPSVYDPITQSCWTPM
ncbi:PREDICTED: protein EXORDIUM-like 6 [Camelina sativa]|uniref:Protein EXORDIUM-like 6 n=1 Tax=Camelina sativa TaxID=90675 RepID=A0ABM0VZV3_CAMSA|nr:PREDICTED: protein EXORDIUM-like 6 [Camelina sativa]